MQNLLGCLKGYSNHVDVIHKKGKREDRALGIRFLYFTGIKLV